MNTTTVGQHRTAEPTGSAGHASNWTGSDGTTPAVKTAFSGITLSIEPGQKVLLLGPSSAGKSTLLHALAGVIHDDDGHSQLGTARIDGHAPADTRGIVGLMQQDPESSWCWPAWATMWPSAPKPVHSA